MSSKYMRFAKPPDFQTSVLQIYISKTCVLDKTVFSFRHNGRRWKDSLFRSHFYQSVGGRLMVFLFSQSPALQARFSTSGGLIDYFKLIK